MSLAKSWVFKMIDTLFLDMDGVLADLDRMIEKRLGDSIENIISKNYDLDSFFYENARKGLFKKLKPNHDLNIIKDMIREVHSRGITIEILTSLGGIYKDEEGIASIAKQKMEWLEKHMSDVLPMIAQFNGVPYCNEKEKFARPTAVLVDDRYSQCERFWEMGGSCIQYDMNFSLPRRTKSIDMIYTLTKNNTKSRLRHVYE